MVREGERKRGKECQSRKEGEDGKAGEVSKCDVEEGGKRRREGNRKQTECQSPPSPSAAFVNVARMRRRRWAWRV